jgi:hypothetical protein
LEKNRSIISLITSRFYLLPLLSMSLLLSMSAASGAENLTAEQVFFEADQRYTGDTSIADYSLTLVDRRGRERVRSLRMFSKEYDDNSKTLTQFDSPADIRGTSYLYFDWDDENLDDDSWLFLPSLQRVKRIATSDTSDSFLGSDFTFADINGFEYNWYDYHFISESDVIDGQDCWVVELVPKPEFKDKAEDATGYSKTQTWIRKDNFVHVRGEVNLIKGNRIKFFSSSEIEQDDGIWTIKRRQVVTTRNGRQEHASVLQIEDVSYNDELSDEMFTTEFMQRGLN